jgi:hypothetical protein
MWIKDDTGKFVQNPICRLLGEWYFDLKEDGRDLLVLPAHRGGRSAILPLRDPNAVIERYSLPIVQLGRPRKYVYPLVLGSNVKLAVAYELTWRPGAVLDSKWVRRHEGLSMSPPKRAVVRNTLGGDEPPVSFAEPSVERGSACV